MSLLRLLLRLLAGKKKPSRRPRVQVGHQHLSGSYRQGREGSNSAALTDLADPQPARTGFKVSMVGLEISGPCYVIDGDTLVIARSMIRLAGIDAPELDQPYGKKAKWELLQLCQGKTIRAVFDGSLSYERGVATCYLPDGRDLSAEMVKIGLALDWPKFSGAKYREFEPAESRKLLWRVDARQNGLMPPTSNRGLKTPL